MPYSPAMWNEPYLETCCRSALHRLALAADDGRPDGLKDGPCLHRLAGMGFAAPAPTAASPSPPAGRARHATEILQRPSPPPAWPLHGLDALRGFAAAWVLAYHDLLRFPRFMLGLEMDVPFAGGFMQAELGVMPVLWFFLISGFVIALTLERCRDGWDFAVRRATRIFPAYWAAIAVIVALALLAPLPGSGFGGTQLLLNLTMLQAYLDVPDLDGVFWSLAVELLFYGYALAAFTARRPRWMPALVLLWALAGLAAAAAERAGLPVSWQLNRLLLLTYGPLLAGGMMLFRLWRRESPTWSAATLAACAAAVLLRFHPVTACSCLLAGALIAWSVHAGPAWLAARPLAALGAISYALYLSHQVVSFTVLAATDEAGWPHGLGILLAIGAALLVAAAITYGVERPALRLLRHRKRTAAPG